MTRVSAHRPGGDVAGLDSRALRRRLLTWYRRNRRELPWRETRDPYLIWISEVMLQQTQVATALPFYLRFVARFPTIAALARATRPQVLTLWAGLGYYRRAGHLLDAARLVVREHAGRIPEDPEVFARLPGVGRYTTGAVLSIAFGTPLPVLDGNVTRVLSRIFALEASPYDSAGAKALWDLATILVPMRGAGDWNQALMELGATVCTPRAPRCDACPVRIPCRARASGRIEDFPPVRTRPATVKVRRAVALIERRGGILVVRHTGSRLDGLWEPPGVELERGRDAGSLLAGALAELGVQARLEPTGRVVRHAITNRSIEVQVWRGRLERSPARAAGLRFVDPRSPAVALTGLALRLTRRSRIVRD